MNYLLSLQKGTDFIVATDFSDQFSQICFHIGEVIRVHSSFEEVAGKHRQQPVQLGNSILCGRVVLRPVLQMFFRPEEKHRTSGVSNIRSPFGHGKGYMADQSFRIGLFDYSITHFDGDRFTAIETWGVDANLFPRE